MQTDASPSVDYPCLDAEAAAEAHDVHPFMTSRAGGKATRGAMKRAVSAESAWVSSACGRSFSLLSRPWRVMCA